MKPGPIFAMVGLLIAGLWMVLQPTLARGAFDYEVRVGAVDLRVEETESGMYRFVEPLELAERGEISGDAVLAELAAQKEAWEARPEFSRTLLGFFNITSWVNFSWVAVGLLGQIAFFGRMFIQWIVSEKSRKSEVPELFWWFSFVGGAFLFTYFVWRTDVVGVLGQSTGVVIYARNLRLIHKQKRRERRTQASATPEPGEVAQPRESGTDAPESQEVADARAAG